MVSVSIERRLCCFKSRVALFEATFEKYHKGSGRVPGDNNWPGANMPYNSGKNFSIDSEVDFFLTEAMNAAKQVADNAQLTTNNHVIEPQPGVITGWNNYFEMYSQPSLANVPEVLLWKQYSFSLSISHDAAYRVKTGCADGYTRTFAESFLMKNGLPIYASNDYQGDVSIDNVKAGRDERLQLLFGVRVRCLILILVRLSTVSHSRNPVSIIQIKKYVVSQGISHVSIIRMIIPRLRMMSCAVLTHALFSVQLRHY